MLINNSLSRNDSLSEIKLDCKRHEFYRTGSNLTTNESSRVFVSHSWDNKDIAIKLEEELTAVNVEVWVDHSDMRPGDTITRRVSEALEWCNTLLLLWSESAATSGWVEHEWGAAFSEHKRIIPCILDEVRVPVLLRNTLHVDLRSFDKGLEELLKALGYYLPKPALKKTKGKRQTQTTTTPKKAAAKKVKKKTEKITQSKTTSKPPIQLRSHSLHNVSKGELKKMLKEKDFFEGDRNNEGKGVNHEYELVERDGEKVVFDHSTTLTWQWSGSDNKMVFKAAEKYVHGLNSRKFAGYSDWRLPTLEEAMSLMEPKEFAHRLYIDSVFDSEQKRIWTGDKDPASLPWFVSFFGGNCNVSIDYSRFVRAVR